MSIKDSVIRADKEFMNGGRLRRKRCALSEDKAISEGKNSQVLRKEGREDVRVPGGGVCRKSCLSYQKEKLFWGQLWEGKDVRGRDEGRGL